jgi:hypothetical protein
LGFASPAPKVTAKNSRVFTVLRRSNDGGHFIACGRTTRAEAAGFLAWVHAAQLCLRDRQRPTRDAADVPRHGQDWTDPSFDRAAGRDRIVADPMALVLRKPAAHGVVGCAASDSSRFAVFLPFVDAILFPAIEFDLVWPGCAFPCFEKRFEA